MTRRDGGSGARDRLLVCEDRVASGRAYGRSPHVSRILISSCCPPVEIAVDIGHAALKPTDVLLQTSPDGRPRVLESMALRRQHVEQLTAPRQQRLELLNDRLPQRTRYGAYPLDAEREHVRVEAVAAPGNRHGGTGTTYRRLTDRGLPRAESDQHREQGLQPSFRYRGHELRL
jgi:hypothetical protein